jgi:hypothetical protein
MLQATVSQSSANINSSWTVRRLHSETAIMAAVEATAKALETATISKTKELKGVSTTK